MSTTMRTNLVLERWQLETLRAMAERRRKSISALVRDIISAHLNAGGRLGRQRQAIQSLAGIVSDPMMRGDDHDQVLYGKRRGK